MADKNQKTFRSIRGFSLVEILVVLAVGLVLTAIAVPAMISQRRLLRSASMPREIMAQLRYARQLAMTERQSVTFEYNDATKLITIINHHNNHKDDDAVFPGCALGRQAVLVAPGYPLTACSIIVTNFPLTQGGLSVGEITYGIPVGSPPLPAGATPFPLATTPLADLTVMTDLIEIPAGSDKKLFITFHNDGSVINAVTGFPQDTAMFFYNINAAQATASAISVVGASGRVKVWRYKIDENIYDE